MDSNLNFMKHMHFPYMKYIAFTSKKLYAYMYIDTVNFSFIT